MLSCIMHISDLLGDIFLQSHIVHIGFLDFSTCDNAATVSHLEYHLNPTFYM